MTINLYINLPVADINRSRSFFQKLGFTFNETFSDETAICMVVNDGCAVMMLSHEKFAAFTPRPIGDANKASEVLCALSLASREAVDRMVATALKTGGAAVRDPEDHGFMYGHAFADPDGHIWEPFWMNPDAMGAGQ